MPSVELEEVRVVELPLNSDANPKLKSEVNQCVDCVNDVACEIDSVSSPSSEDDRREDADSVEDNRVYV